MGAQVLLQQGSGREGSRQSIARASTGAPRGPNTSVMRLVLEWLGLVRPDPARREPVAVPSWGPAAVAAIIALTATGLAALARVIVGAIV